MTRCVMRTGRTTVRTTLPPTLSPGEYWRCGSSGWMSNSAKFRGFEAKGDFILESSDRELCEACELTEGARLALEGMVLH